MHDKPICFLRSSAGFVLTLDYRAPRFYLWSLARLSLIFSYLYRDVPWRIVNTRRVRMKWTVENMGFVAEVRRVINNFHFKIFQNADERGVEKCWITVFEMILLLKYSIWSSSMEFSLKINFNFLWEKRKENSKSQKFSLLICATS